MDYFEIAKQICYPYRKEKKMNPEEARNFCSECGDPITTQHEIDLELCDECFQILKEDEERDRVREEMKDTFDRDQERADFNGEL